MRVFEDEMDCIDDEDEEVCRQSSVSGKRFNFDGLYLRYAIKVSDFINFRHLWLHPYWKLKAWYMVSSVLFSDDDDDAGDESSLATQPYLMEKVDSGESSLFELSREHQSRVKVRVAM